MPSAATGALGTGPGRGMLRYINYRMRLTLDDSRVLIGRFLAFDKHMNIVLADTDEFRRAKKSSTATQRRALGLVLLRGEAVVHLSVESAPPPPARKRPLPAGAAGRGVPVPLPAGRGAAPAGLAGPVPGVGVGAAALQPHVAAQPRMYAAPAGIPTAPPGWGLGAPPFRPPQMHPAPQNMPQAPPPYGAPPQGHPPPPQ